MALTSLQVIDVCTGQAGQKNPWGWYNNGKQCKYLIYEMVGKDYKPLCMKLAPGIIEQKRKSGHLPPGFDKMSDNCPGYRYMKYVEQGYDKP